MFILSSLFALLIAARILGALIATIRDLNADEQRRRLLAPRRTV